VAGKEGAKSTAIAGKNPSKGEGLGYFFFFLYSPQYRLPLMLIMEVLRHPIACPSNRQTVKLTIYIYII